MIAPPSWRFHVAVGLCKYFNFTSQNNLMVCGKIANLAA